MKRLMLTVALIVSTIGIAQAKSLNEKYCKKLDRKLDKEISSQVSEGVLTSERGNLIKLIAHNTCLAGVESGMEEKEFLGLFNPVTIEDCDEIQTEIQSQFGSAYTKEFLQVLTSELTKTCNQSYVHGESVLEYGVKVKSILSDYGIQI